LYPELIIGIGYRWFDAFTKAAKIKTQTCWKVSNSQVGQVVYRVMNGKS